jgi:crotonobetainyl-CoA:carnitine CoA-transferase CaiB-like acyl-CoA transferase
MSYTPVPTGGIEPPHDGATTALAGLLDAALDARAYPRLRLARSAGERRLGQRLFCPAGALWRDNHRCRDGRWLILTILNEDRQWPALARAVARADLLDDARFATKPQRLANSQALIRILDEAFATYDLDYWRDVLAANGLVFDMVAKVSEISSDDQMLANQVLVPFEDEAVLTVNSPLFVQGASKVPPRRPPDIGQHSEEILREAGYDDAALMELRASGVIV